ncbi:MAG: hybrid sensor histidine kinase/response regulator [Bacteroidales bacterium]|nr:hybrid sensor histidine kinase/response regulator [Bacteroidales bacterium]
MEKRNTELQDSHRDIQKISKELNDLNEARIRFYINVSHELRTPLTLITDPLGRVLSEPGLGDADRERLTLVHDNALRLKSLIEELLLFRDIDTNSSLPDTRFFNVTQMVNEVVRLYKGYAQTHYIALETRLNDVDVWMEGSKSKVATILHNLLTNAFNYTADYGSISVRLGLIADRFFQIEIEDNGRGIAQDDLAHLFESRLSVLPKEKPGKFVGFGLGLPLVKSIVDQYNGEIEVESAPDKGTIFRLRFLQAHKHQTSVTENIVQNESLAKFTVSNNQLPDNGLKKYTLLFVDDNHDLCKYVKKELSPFINVVTKYNGNDGLDFTKRNFPDLVISDVMMPIMNGISLCKGIKDNDETGHIQVVLLTALDEDKSKIEAYNAGADAYVIKPFSIAALTSQVKAIFANKERNRRQFAAIQANDTSSIAYSAQEQRFLQKAMAIVRENMESPDFNNSMFIRLMNTSKTALYKSWKT